MSNLVLRNHVHDFEAAAVAELVRDINGRNKPTLITYFYLKSKVMLMTVTLDVCLVQPLQILLTWLAHSSLLRVEVTSSKSSRSCFIKSQLGFK